MESLYNNRCITIFEIRIVTRDQLIILFKIVNMSIYFICRYSQIIFVILIIELSSAQYYRTFVWTLIMLKYIASHFSEPKQPLSLQIGASNNQLSNSIKTTSYNIFTFLPQSIVATIIQFKRLANVYFLVTAVLQFIPAISPLSPISAIAPLIFVLFISLIRSAIQQIGKYRYDLQANSSQFLVYSQPSQQSPQLQPNLDNLYNKNQSHCQRTSCNKVGNWKIRRSDQLRIGNIVKIQQDQRFPADLLLLSSSSQDGKVYIQTSSLDGQKNLKIRTVLKSTDQLYKNIEAISKINIKPLLTIEQPNQQLYNFNAMIQIKHEDQRISQKIRKSSQFIKINQFLYRQSVLKNTQYIVGVVIYVGKNTKSMLNSLGTRQKMSRLEKRVNFYMIFIFVFQLILIIFCSLLRIILFTSSQSQKSFSALILRTQLNSNIIEFLLTSSSYFILLNTMIPISLLVSIEIVKFGQGFFIDYDKMMSKKDPTKINANVIQAKAFRSSINEELGMVDYVFTDKTGTLTRNQMILQEIIIGNQIYTNEVQNENRKSYFNNQLYTKAYNKDARQLTNYFISSLRRMVENQQLKSSVFITNILQKDNKKLLNTLMLIILSTCHECILANNKNFQNISNQVEYHGQSPDEITLVSSAAQLGFKFIDNSYGKIKLSINQSKQVQNQTYLNQFHTFQFIVQELFEFNSDRKRMSIIISHQLFPEYKILVCKGADNTIGKLLRKQYTDQSQNPVAYNFYSDIKQRIQQHSKIGLRTLLYGYKFIKLSQYTKLHQKLLQSSEFLQKKQSVIKQLQQNLYLCGATAVEDKLQNQVENVIEDLIKANIKVCMLTGDKLETAENIAKSCRLFKEDWKIIRIGENSGDADIFKGYCKVREFQSKNQNYGLLVQGAAIDIALRSFYFAEVLQNCSAAVCCRITPKNKAQVVKLAKNNLNKLVLAIGDGANDVPMIQAANIGIGIYGNEGMNAVQASDFAIPQFKCLWRLLFVHGRWNYIRIAELIKYFFYKNMVFTLAQLWFAYFCQISGTSIYDATYLVLFNTIFTGGPIMIRALIQQDLNYVQIIEQVKTLNIEAHGRRRKKVVDLYQNLLGQSQIYSQKVSQIFRFAKNNSQISIINKFKHQQNDQSQESYKDIGNKQKNIKISKITIDKNMKYLFPLLYSHSQQQKSLTPTLFLLLIIQSILQSLGIFFIVSQGTQSPELWIFSISLYTIVLALVTVRICFDINYWTWLMVSVIVFTSVGPYLGFVYLMSLINIELAGTFKQLFISIDFYLLLGLALGVCTFLQATFSIINKYYFPQSIDFVRKQWKKMYEKERQEEKVQRMNKRKQRNNSIYTRYHQILKSSRSINDRDEQSSISELYGNYSLAKTKYNNEDIQIEMKQLNKVKNNL